MKYYLIAGEASGDLHGAALISELRELKKDSQFQAWGGDKMKEAGAHLDMHYKEVNYMGFLEVFLNIFKILSNFKKCKNSITQFHPEVVILIDYPGFNLRMAKWLKKKGYKVVYYISPQLWAWNSKRVKIIKKYVDKMVCILPFEVSFYQNFNYPVDYVGHPLVSHVDSFRNNPEPISSTQLEPPYTILMPGSRNQEIQKHLPLMLSLATRLPEHQFYIAGMDHVDQNVYQTNIENANLNNVNIIIGANYELLNKAQSAIVSSGTATLETALFGVPQVVLYKGSRISYWIGKRLINVKYISLVNLILDQPLIEELIQDDANPENLYKSFMQLGENQDKITQGYQNIRSILGSKDASLETAKIIAGIT